jgi:hypothetical protein
MKIVLMFSNTNKEINPQNMTNVSSEGDDHPKSETKKEFRSSRSWSLYILIFFKFKYFLPKNGKQKGKQQQKTHKIFLSSFLNIIIIII